jgi:hypothetical protein
MENNLDPALAWPIIAPDASPYFISHTIDTGYYTDNTNMYRGGYGSQSTIDELQRDIALLKLEIQQLKNELKNTLRSTEKEHRKLSV